MLFNELSPLESVIVVYAGIARTKPVYITMIFTSFCPQGPNLAFNNTISYQTFEFASRLRSLNGK